MSIKVLIVDDSPTIRALLRHALSVDPGIQVVGEAGDPYEARAAIKALSPDVVTLDIEMPRMSGLEFLGHLMRLRPTRVIMISTLTSAGAEATLEALALGAIDYIAKPSGGQLVGAFQDLPQKIRMAAASKLNQAATKTAPESFKERAFQPKDRTIVIGASTGGVQALTTLIEALPKNCPPILITQHMPAHFTEKFATRLNGKCQPEIVEATDGAEVMPGRIYLAPGGERHLELVPGLRPVCRLVEADPVSGHRPSVDVLFRSATKLGHRAVAVLLTGMGSDGAIGMGEIRRAGGLTIGQDEASSVVYGMARAAIEQNHVEHVLPLSKIASFLMDKTGSYV